MCNLGNNPRETVDVTTELNRIERRARLVALSKLTPHPENPRTITPARLAQLVDALRTDPGMLEARPLIALPDGRVLGGNQRLLAARELGWKRIPVVEVDLDEETAKLWMLRDNNGYGEWDDGQLAAMLEGFEGSVDLALTGFDEGELERLLAPAPAERGEPPEPGPVPAEPRSVRGEVYELGPHRLMCGDAFSDGRDFYAGVSVGCVLTDPPYGIALDADFTHRPNRAGAGLLGDHPQRRHRPVVGDDQAFDAAPLIALFAAVDEQFWFGGDYYRRTLSDDDRDGAYLVWDKRNEATDRVPGSGFELIWSRQAHKRDVLRHFSNGAFGVEAANRVHPTQKPTPLLREILTRWAPEDCVVADPFAGSGSTLLAAEQLGRRCLAMEIDPGYCDVIRDRWAAWNA